MITLATLKDATAQEVFDQGVEHLLSQGVQCSEVGACCYRLGSLKCVGGCFIADSEYTPEIERNDWNSLVIYEIVPKEHQLLIRNLQ